MPTAMKYYRCEWNYPSLDEPRFLLCELNESGMEVRKIEIYRDGRKGYATLGESCGSTRLRGHPIAEYEMESDAQFQARTISRMEFEDVWTHRRRPIPWLWNIP